MKPFQIFVLLFLVILGSVQVFGAITCSSADDEGGAGYTCGYASNYLQAQWFDSFPLNTKALTMIFYFGMMETTQPACGTSYPYSMISITIEDGSGNEQEVVELVHKSLSTISYKAKGVEYHAQTLSGGGAAFQLDNEYELRVSIDITNNKVLMATTYGSEVHYNAPELTSAGFPSSWKFDSTTTFWIGGKSGGGARLGMYVETLTSWNGYLPYPSTYTAELIGDYKLREYQGYSLSDDDSDSGTAYLGASTSGSSDTINSPNWMGERAILKFTSTQFMTLSAFTVSQPTGLLLASLSISFWIKITTAPGSTSYIFRYSNSGMTLDRFALKVDSSLQLQVCSGGVCQTAFTALSSNTWAHISANWALMKKPTSNFQGYYSVYKDGSLLKYQNLANVPSSTTAYSAANDKVRFGGGFTGQLTAIKIYSPGSLQVNKPTWCTASTCTADLGATNPPTCLIQASCHSSCSGCTDSTDFGCLACASGKFFYKGKCGTCPAGTYINDDYCQSCIEHCATCSSPLSCSVCDTGYTVFGDICVVACPANCNTCDGAGICSVCDTTFLLFDNTCVSGCPSGSYQSGTNCLHCSTDCDACTDATTCTTCSSGHFLHNAACVGSCPLTTFTLGSTCLGCPGDCNVCTDGNTCTTCSSGHFLHNTGCVNICPQTTYTLGTDCLDCPDDCKICVDGTTCSTCSDGFYLHGAGCVGSCPLTFYALGTNCLGCPNDCNTCSDGSTCTACVLTHFLHQAQCVGSCPTKTFTSGSNCLDCPNDCDTCTDGNTCTVCASPSYLFKNHCYSSCPLTSFQSGTDCLNCPSHCDVCLDGNTCITCTPGSYFYNQACYETCPPAAPFRSPTDDSTLCYETCPTQTPYIYNKICYKSCPPEAPYFSKDICSSEDPDSTITEPAKLNNVAESTANTLLIIRSIASPSTPTPLMFGSITKLLQYTRYMNISRSDDLEKLFQAEDDSGDEIPMPTMTDRMQGAFESSPVPYVFEKYGTSSNFLLSQGDNLLGILTVFGLFVIVLLLQKGAFYVRNIPLARSVIVRSRFFFQNYFIGQFYEMLGDIAFSAVLELKTITLVDKYSLLSFIACIFCVIFGGTLFVANIWIVTKYQNKKKSYQEEKSQKDALEKFSEEYKGIELLFNDFEDASFTHQALLIFFVGRNILFCLIIALFYESPMVQCILLLLINLAIVGYYLWKRPIKSRMGFVEQLVYELILLAVSVCFFILVVVENSENTSAIVTTVSEIIIVLNIACKFLALAFLAVSFACVAWEYLQVLKGILQNSMKKKRATVTPASEQTMTTVESNQALDFTDRPVRFNSEMIFDMMTEQNITVTQIDTKRRYLMRRPRVMPENSFALNQSSTILQSDVSFERTEASIRGLSRAERNAPLDEIIERRRVIRMRNRVRPNY